LLVDVGGPGLVDGLHRAVVPAGVGDGEDGAEPDRLSFQAAGAGRGVRGSRTACAGGQGEYQRGRGRAACEGSDGGSPAHGAVAPCHRAGIGRSAGTGGSSVPAGVDGDGVARRRLRSRRTWAVEAMPSGWSWMAISSAPPAMTSW